MLEVPVVHWTITPRSLHLEDGTVTRSPQTGPRSAGAVFQHFRDGRPRTRSDLATATGFSRPAVLARVDELLDAGLVVPAGESASTGGRPPAAFLAPPSAGLILAADLGATHGRLAITDLAADVLAESSLEITIGDGPEAVLEAVTSELLGLLDGLGRPRQDVFGVGVGLPGPVEHGAGRPTSPPIMPGWDGFDVPSFLQRAVDVPTLVDNDVNIMALGEHRAQWPTVQGLVFIKVATGIGAGIITDGQLWRGEIGAAGDLGHMAVPGGRQVPCRCGNAGCLEALASGHAMVSALQEQGCSIERTAQLVDLVRAGDTTAMHAVREAGRDIGRVVAGMVNLLNPSVIVIGGTISAVGEHLLAGIREVVYRRSLPLATQELRIVTSRTMGRAGVLGAAQMVMQDVLSPSAIDRRVAAVSSRETSAQSSS